MSQKNSDSSSVLEDISKQIDSNIQEIEKLIPEDAVAKATGAKVGTEEHLQQGELLNKVKSTNSTRRVNRTLGLLVVIGYVGLAISSIIKFTGIIYDIDFHVPFLKDVIGEIGVAILGFFITVIILIMTHITSDGVVNNKWKAVPRLILIWLLMLGLAASFYFDYRAVSNYTSVVVEKVKQKKINNSSDTEGIAVKSVEGAIEVLRQNLTLYQQSITASQSRLIKIGESRTQIDESMSRVKTLKETTNSKREIKKLNQNIYTSRKQLKELTAEEERINAKQKETMAQIASLQKQIDARQSQKGILLKNVDTQMDEVQMHRLIFLFTIILFIEFTSFAGLLADFLGNKNLEVDLKNKLDQLNNNTDTMSVLRGHLSQQEVRQARDFDKELTIRGAVSDVYTLSAIASMHRHAEHVKGFTESTHKIGEATQEVTVMAVKGIASGIKANLAMQRIESMEKLLIENKELDKKNE